MFFGTLGIQNVVVFVFELNVYGCDDCGKYIN